MKLPLKQKLIFNSCYNHLEGVSNYLTEEAVDDVFAFTKKFQSSLSIIFTYLDSAVLNNPNQYKETRQLFDNLKANEEQWTFGFDPRKLSVYLKQFGLNLIEDLNASDYRNLYIPGRKNILKDYEFYRVAMTNKQ